MRQNRARRHCGFIERVTGRQLGRQTDTFFRVAGPALKQVAMTAAPALIARGMPVASAVTAVAGQAVDGYSQLRSAMGD